MKVLITGSSGQLGNRLILTKPKNVNLIITNRSSLDLTNAEQCYYSINKFKPDFIINCAAYTNVDKAEDERSKANSINSEAPKIFAEALNEYGGRLIHISTDYVFNGLKKKPYLPFERTDPINFYGKSKLEGELNIQKVMQGSKNYNIIRTSWLMGPFGKNFFTTIYKLHNSKDKIRVIKDQIGTPTSTITLSKVCWKIVEEYSSENKIKSYLPSILHWCDKGMVSWYEIAVAIGKMGNQLGIIKEPAKVIPIDSNNYPAKALRPKYSALDSSITSYFLNLPLISWKEALKENLKLLI